jgi:ribonuclease HI
VNDDDCLELFSDGASRGNPGPAAAGVVLKSGGTIIFETGRYLGLRTNNQAEYLALILALETALRYKPSKVCCYLDSELVVRQIQGRYKVKDPILQKLFARAQKLLSSFPAVTFEHVPREENRLADKLANQAINLTVK